jgi:Rrf2 family protein
MFCSELPRRTQESLKILVCLAHASGPLQAKEVAARAELPPAQTSKILQSLGWAGFAVSRRGTKGGFWLAQPAGRIRAAEVINFFTHRNRGHSKAQQDPLTRALGRVLARCQKAFDEITIADLARSMSCRPHNISRSKQKARRVPEPSRGRPASKRSPSIVRGAKS